jgi:hypothetical protein
MHICTTTPTSSVDLRAERAKQLLTRVPAATEGVGARTIVMPGTVLATLVAAKRHGCVQAQPLLACENNDANAIWTCLTETALVSSFLLHCPVVDYVVTVSANGSGLHALNAVPRTVAAVKAEFVISFVSDSG